MNDPGTQPAQTGRWPRRLAMALTSVLLVFGPWPVDDSSFEGSEPQLRTLQRLESLPVALQGGPIRVGTAEVDLTPATPRPLAGFIGQIRTPFVGVDTHCFARALTVESKAGTWTILTADLLLINAKMARAVADRAGLPLDQLYFTASHTHGGPGGWGDHPLEQLVAGSYDPSYFDTLANQLAGVVTSSRSVREPASLGFVQVQTKGRQSNRVDPSIPTHDRLSAFVFKPVDGPPEAAPLAILAIFGAHATVSHPVPPRLGGDYPSALVAELKRRTGARSVLFASGAVGDASPSRPKAGSQARSAEILGQSLAEDLLTALPSAQPVREPVVGSLRLEVDLPPVRLPFFVPKLRFSPLMTWWIGDQRTHLHALRLGSAVLVGFPGDYSGHLADRLVNASRKLGLSVVATSFVGDYRGYLVSEPVFREKPRYETRWMSFYGPWSGDFLNDLARRMLERLKGINPSGNRPEPTERPATRIILFGLILAALVVTGRPGCREIRSRVGWWATGVVLVSLVGFLAVPNLFAWARFGLPYGIRVVGGPIGLAALLLAWRREWGKAALGLGIASGLLAASWPVVLMVARGWIRWGIKASMQSSTATKAS